MEDLLKSLLSDAITSVGVVPVIVVTILVLAVYALSRGDVNVGGLLGSVLSGDDDDDEPLDFDVEIDHEFEGVEVKQRPDERVTNDDLEKLK